MKKLFILLTKVSSYLNIELLLKLKFWQSRLIGVSLNLFEKWHNRTPSTIIILEDQKLEVCGDSSIQRQNKLQMHLIPSDKKGALWEYNVGRKCASLSSLLCLINKFSLQGKKSHHHIKCYIFKSLLISLSSGHSIQERERAHEEPISPLSFE